MTYTLFNIKKPDGSAFSTYYKLEEANQRCIKYYREQDGAPSHAYLDVFRLDYASWDAMARGGKAEATLVRRFFIGDDGLLTAIDNPRPGPPGVPAYARRDRRRAVT